HRHTRRLPERTVTNPEGEHTGTALFTATVKASRRSVPARRSSDLTVTAPAKLEYTVGEELDLTGMTVTAVYSDETTKDVTEEADISGHDKDTEGTQEITVPYTEGEQTVTATFNVTVKASGSEVPEV